jgi:hypothetical protein
VGEEGLAEASLQGEGGVAAGASERKRTRGREEGMRVEDGEGEGEGEGADARTDRVGGRERKSFFGSRGTVGVTGLLKARYK